jgi:hypothetical protein
VRSSSFAALRRAQEEKERMLDEAERARIAQMKKVQGMLAKVQKKGYLYKLEKSAVLGTSKWKKRYGGGGVLPLV